MNEVAQRLEMLAKNPEALDAGNQILSEHRSLRLADTFATNGTYLHEIFFAGLGGDGVGSGELKTEIENTWGSFEAWQQLMVSCGLSVRGWAILAWDTHQGILRIFGGDAQNHGGVWGAIPLIAIDVYEHAYVIDHGANRKAYLGAVFQNLDWEEANRRFASVRAWHT